MSILQIMIGCGVLFWYQFQRVAAPLTSATASDSSTLFISAVFWYGTAFALIFPQN